MSQIVDVIDFQSRKVETLQLPFLYLREHIHLDHVVDLILIVREILNALYLGQLRFNQLLSQERKLEVSSCLYHPLKLVLVWVRVWD